MFRAVQSSSEGEGEAPCGSDQGLEQLGDVSGSNVEVFAEEEVNMSVCTRLCRNVHMFVCVVCACLAWFFLYAVDGLAQWYLYHLWQWLQ